MTQTQETLEQAIAAIRDGDKTLGKTLLADVLKVDRNNVQAWIWLTQTDITYEEKIKSLQNALKIEPDNETAKAGLKHLQGQAAIDFDSGDGIADAPPVKEKLSSESKPAKKRWSNWVALSIFAGIGVMVCVCSVLFAPLSNIESATPTPGPTGPTPLQSRNIVAANQCEDVIREMLKSPSSAVFIDDTQQVFSVNGKPKNYHIVRGQVDAQNSFGAMLRSTYYCELHYLPEDPWRWFLDDARVE